MRFDHYDVGEFFDEMFGENHQARASARKLVNNIENLPEGEFMNRQRAVERALLQMGITFNVYGERAGMEKIFPFDLVPRIVPAAEWSRIERGLKQRITALNQFIHDVYHDQKIIKDGVVPAEIVLSSKAYRKECMGFNPPRGIWCHLTGTDLVRHRDGQTYVLEDNLRCPSGVSYVLENRAVMKSMFPQLFVASKIRPVANYPGRLRDMLEYLAPDLTTGPRCVLLTPGTHNSAYFEHSFLAQQMGIELAWIPIREEAANKTGSSLSEYEPELLAAQPWDLHQFFIEACVEQERIMRPFLKSNDDFPGLNFDAGVSVNKVTEQGP